MSISNNEQSNEIARLIAQRDALRARIDAIRADFREGLDADSEERAIQLENREVLEGIARAAADELLRVEQRLVELKGQ